MQDHGALVQHAAVHLQDNHWLTSRPRQTHPVASDRPQFVIEWTSGRLDGDDGAEAVTVVPCGHFDNDAVSVKKTGVEEPNPGDGWLDGRPTPELPFPTGLFNHLPVCIL